MGFIESGAFKVLSRMRKLLFRGILASLGVGSLVTGLPSTVLAANLSVLSQPQSGLNKLSSESLRGLENRNNSKDSPTIIDETKPLTDRDSILLSRHADVPVVRVPSELLDLIKKVEVNTGGSSLDSEELVKVRYRMDLT
jgi:hypothetical protein